MKKLLVSATILCLSSFAFAQANPADCAAKAIDKNGKPLAGAAKNSFMKKCTGEAKVQAPAAQSGCEEKAVSKDGKPLHGAAKSTFMKKCTQDAQAAK